MEFDTVFRAVQAAGQITVHSQKGTVYTCTAVVHHGRPCIVGVVGEPGKPSAVTVYAEHWPSNRNLSGTSVGGVTYGLLLWAERMMLNTAY
jgi:hypothetical protein